MRHNDYVPVGKCKSCKAKVYSPVAWASKNYDVPRVPTCQHPVALDPWKKQKK
uniref:Uncharacterized protein n=1 Tax=viral metagenome TaxID=1070528 RepID=A0A6M3IHY8_9ZZZZ